MGKATRASLLVLILAGSAQAGWIQNGVNGTSPDPPPDAAEEQTANGSIQSDDPEGFTETVLSLLESALSLL